MTHRQKEVEASLKDCWVLLMDSHCPPQSVIASDEETASALSSRDWLVCGRGD